MKILKDAKHLIQHENLKFPHKTKYELKWLQTSSFQAIFLITIWPSRTAIKRSNNGGKAEMKAKQEEFSVT